ncbi:MULTISPECIES: hypothetical protein [Bradyrhizobium]|uniref:hypothetical protein n=1 Tax=Bradyrhizobium TaxID=374 RepID=UPI000841F000|nr:MULTISPECIES: hypothetical protein [Bradyrhizobium]MCP1838337.1 hypothetical protein [Bradyrhizobium sp. USDA 4538]MCP1909398.1 hypothetical protein [Bradyrhizobium elkanii]ODM73440.1 hypothetical protein A6452_41055 [Bradyrhizobium elkanii]ODM86087.1 hypothetical protein A6X20_11000 [Bradyrhizobium elkanii]
MFRRPTIISQEHRDLALNVADQRRFANAKDMLSQHARFLLDGEKAKVIVASITKQVARLVVRVVRAEAVSEKDAEMIKAPSYTRAF